MGQLEDRIAAVIRREVPCHPPAADRIAREVIRELEADYVLVPKSHTLAQQAPVLCKCGCGYVIREGVDN